MASKIMSSLIRKIFSLLMMTFIPALLFSQGFNHVWLLGYNFSPTSDKARINFDANSYSLITEQRKMSFFGTESNISDAYGNFLMSSNGVWIANANNDTMLNGSGLNPGDETAFSPDGLLLAYANIILPKPGDSSKYILFHHATSFLQPYYKILHLFYSQIDITLDSGLGAVTSKNDTAISDTLNAGIAACKHANGRDWWIVMSRDTSDIIYKILLTPNGIQGITSQQVNVAPYPWSNTCQPTFSPDGTKFAYTSYDTLLNRFVFLLNFDRCTGIFSNPQIIDITDWHVGFGLAFSASSKYLYATSSANIFQINTDTSNVQASLQIVAQNDTFYSPYPSCCLTDFYFMYLAADGKIYITSGNGVQHIHYINYPDSAGMACDVQQHAINLGIWSFRAVPNHPNYYLGCDTTGGCLCYVGIEETNKHDFKFSISPNPSNGNFKIIYLLPQNKSGTFEIFDVNGRKVYSQNLPQWSTLQFVSLPKLADGIYNCLLTSGEGRASKKIVVLKE